MDLLIQLIGLDTNESTDLFLCRLRSFVLYLQMLILIFVRCCVLTDFVSCPADVWRNQQISCHYSNAVQELLQCWQHSTWKWVKLTCLLCSSNTNINSYTSIKPWNPWQTFINNSFLIFYIKNIFYCLLEQFKV